MKPQSLHLQTMQFHIHTLSVFTSVKVRCVCETYFWNMWNGFGVIVWNRFCFDVWNKILSYVKQILSECVQSIIDICETDYSSVCETDLKFVKQILFQSVKHNLQICETDLASICETEMCEIYCGNECNRFSFNMSTRFLKYVNPFFSNVWNWICIFVIYISLFSFCFTNWNNQFQALKCWNVSKIAETTFRNTEITFCKIETEKI